MSNLQGKENTEIPKEVINAIKKEFRKRKFTEKDKKSMNGKKMRVILKRLGYNDYFEHIMQIMNITCNIPPPTISRKIEARVKELFLQMQKPYEMFKGERKNCLQYSYVLYKLFELLEKDDLTEYLARLKSVDKLRQQEKIWKKICEYNRWQFIETPED